MTTQRYRIVHKTRERYGQTCTMVDTLRRAGDCLVEFEDGARELVSRFALRHAGVSSHKPLDGGA